MRWDSWAAWWGGDFAALRSYVPGTAPNGYWAKRDKHPQSRQIHLPMAADIARTSAELLFGDSPTLDFGVDTVQGVWDEISAEMGWTNSLLEGAEIGTALGGVYLRPVWDQTVAPHPLLTVVRGDEAIPQWRYGRLASVTFVSELGERDGHTWRWLEHHEPGQIRHELWKGTNTSIGRLLPLTEHELTAPIAEQTGGIVDTRDIRPDGGLLVDYVPNDLPQPLSRWPHGRADIQGAESLLDALDGAWASWMRDLDLGKARVIVSQEMLETAAPTTGSTSRYLGRFRRNEPAKVFDTDAEVFSPLAGLPADDGGKATPITPVEFKLRVTEHADTCAALVEQIASRAGYAPQTFGMHVEGQLSGTAINRRERRSTVTRNRKRRYWAPALARCAETLMLINRVVFNGPTVTRPTLEWPADQADPRETAETVELLRRAETISTETAVQMAHPEWGETQITEEVNRIRAEHPTSPDPSGFETPDQLEGTDA